jgi:hypothetical protein
MPFADECRARFDETSVSSNQQAGADLIAHMRDTIRALRQDLEQRTRQLAELERCYCRTVMRDDETIAQLRTGRDKVLRFQRWIRNGGAAVVTAVTKDVTYYDPDKVSRATLLRGIDALVAGQELPEDP